MRPLQILSIFDAGEICAALRQSNLCEHDADGTTLTADWLQSRKPHEILARASTASVAVVKYSPRAGHHESLFRCVWLTSQLGVPVLIVAIEADELPPDGRKGFDRLIQRFANYIKDRCAFHRVLFVPVETTSGGNITDRASNIGWYMGPTIADFLDDEVGPELAKQVLDAGECVESDHFQARLIWLDDAPLLPWRPHKLLFGDASVTGSVSAIKYEVDADIDTRVARNRLFKGDVGVCNIKSDTSRELTSFADDREAGTFLVQSLEDGRVVGFGLIDHSLRRATNVKWQETSVTPDLRAENKKQSPTILWFTGLSGAGKSTIADLVEQKLAAAGKHTMLLDGDNVRHGLNKDLGFTDADRVENIRRIAEVSKLMCEAGLIVMVSFISPFRAERQLARETAGKHGFCEIFVSTPLAVAEQRDVKGLYAKARRGELKNFTGIDSPYEPPENPEIIVDTSKEEAEAAAARIVSELFGL